MKKEILNIFGKKKMADILKLPNKLKIYQLKEVKIKLFNGYSLDMIKFIRNLKKISFINFKCLKK